MSGTITTDLVEAYSFCPRKAFQLATGEPHPEPHETVWMVGTRRASRSSAPEPRVTFPDRHYRTFAIGYTVNARDPPHHR
jgi:hypothetical protein